MEQAVRGRKRGRVMGDLISRQAAIDCEYQVKIINDIEYVMLSEVQMKMRKLPSAQPEIIRCKDCKHHAKFSSKCNKLHLTPMRPNDYCSYGERAEE